MSEFDDKLSALLSDPGSMTQVMKLAQQLSENFGKEQSSPLGNGGGSKADPTDISKLMGALDPGMVMKLLPLLQELNNSNSQTMSLLYALKPFLAVQKQDKIDRAAKLARMICVGKKLFGEMGGLGIV